MQPERVANRWLAQVEYCRNLESQFIYGTLDGKRNETRILALAQVPRELGKCDAPVRGDVEGRVACLVPAIVADASSKTRVEHAERGVRRDVANAHPAPWTDVSGEHD